MYRKLTHFEEFNLYWDFTWASVKAFFILPVQQQYLLTCTRIYEASYMYLNTSIIKLWIIQLLKQFIKCTSTILTSSKGVWPVRCMYYGLAKNFQEPSVKKISNIHTYLTNSYRTSQRQ